MQTTILLIAAACLVAALVLCFTRRIHKPWAQSISIGIHCDADQAKQTIADLTEAAKRLNQQIDRAQARAADLAKPALSKPPKPKQQPTEAKRPAKRRG